MPRVKKGSVAPNVEPINVYATALYARLSVLDNGKADGDSLESQIALMERYISERPYLRYVKLYQDNGYTGTNFDRPGWDELMDDVRKGKITCIVVKDLSRLGRNYIETGEFLERVCPQLGLRFISINDGYDSASLNSTEELAASLKNIINDYYAKDISRKCSSALSIKRKSGKYIGSYAPYGYLKDPADKNQLIVDSVTAPTVVKIFEWRSSGDSFTAIMRRLNELSIPSPGRYRLEQGIVTNNNTKPGAQVWNRHVLRDILANPIYIGHLVQGKCRASLYQGIPAHTVAPSEWDISYNTHEPLISQDLFDAVQAYNKQKADTYHEQFGKHTDLPSQCNPYGSKLICADCGRPLKLVRSLSRNGKQAYYTYHCPTFREHRESGCFKKRIRAIDLDTAVLTALVAQISVFLDRQAMLVALAQHAKHLVASENITVQQNALRTEIEKKGKLAAALYTDWKNDILTYEEYSYAKEKYAQEIAILEQELAELTSRHATVSDPIAKAQHWANLMAAYKAATAVTPELVSIFVDSIQLDRNSVLHIKFLFEPDLAALEAEISRARKEAA